MGIIIETELWPNLIYQARAAKVPLFLANARLSDSSFTNYLKFKVLFKPLLNEFTGILCQGKEDAKRFLALGARKELVHFMGNMKFDLSNNKQEESSFSELKNCWGNERVVVIAASTHDNEEALVLSELKRLQLAIPNVLLLIAPRHPERFQKVYQLALQSGFNTGLRSTKSSISPNNQVILLDCLGELLSFYKLSDYAFVGGSLVPVGGHNVLEPIAMNIPVFCGNHIQNFKEICRDLQHAKAILLVNNAEELMDAIIKVHTDNVLKYALIKNASSVLISNKGSVTRHLDRIEANLS